ncbi:MAG: hypothetical protein V7727_20865, partial [Sneathiella sp.]
MTIRGMGEKEKWYKSLIWIALSGIVAVLGVVGGMAAGVPGTSADIFKKAWVVADSTFLQTIAICVSIFGAIFMANKQMKNAREVADDVRDQSLEDRKNLFETHVSKQSNELLILSMEISVFSKEDPKFFESFLKI